VMLAILFLASRRDMHFGCEGRVLAVCFIFCVALCFVEGFRDSARQSSPYCPFNENNPPAPLVNPTLCEEYAANACCTSEQISGIDTYVRLSLSEQFGDFPGCLNLQKFLYCGVFCDPSIYPYYNTNSNNSELDVCLSFCQVLFNLCQNVEVVLGMTVLEYYKNAGAFCRASAPDFTNPYFVLTVIDDSNTNSKPCWKGAVNNVTSGNSSAGTTTNSIDSNPTTKAPTNIPEGFDSNSNTMATSGGTNNTHITSTTTPGGTNNTHITSTTGGMTNSSSSTTGGDGETAVYVTVAVVSGVIVSLCLAMALLIVGAMAWRKAMRLVRKKSRKQVHHLEAK